MQNLYHTMLKQETGLVKEFYVNNKLKAKIRDLINFSLIVNILCLVFKYKLNIMEQKKRGEGGGRSRIFLYF